MEANYVSAYDGQLVIRWTPTGRSFSLGPVTILDRNRERPNEEGIKTVKHERGHYDQYKEIGLIKYAIGLGIPSVLNGYFNPYYSQPWEVTADTWRDVDRYHTPEAIALGERYMKY